MAVVLVGSRGAISTGATGAAVNPSWGAGETPTAGNFVACGVSGTYPGGAATMPATPAGWSVAASLANGTDHESTALFYKVAAGSDAAPQIAAATNMAWGAGLIEFSGLATSLPLDKAGTVAANASPGTLVTSAPDTASGQLVLYVCTQNNTLAAMSGTPNNWTKNDVTNATTPGMLFGWGVTTANAAANSDSITFTDASSNMVGVIASFLLLPPHHTLPDSDITTTGWTVTPLWSKIDDADDATLITATLA